MHFIKSLIILVVAFIALSFTAESITYKSYSVKDVTQSCEFTLEGGACTSNTKCGANQDTTYSYLIAASASQENTYTINGFNVDKCDGTADVTSQFACDSGKAVDVTFSNNNKVQITCVADSSSDASSVAIGFGALVAAVASILL